MKPDPTSIPNISVSLFHSRRVAESLPPGIAVVLEEELKVKVVVTNVSALADSCTPGGSWHMRILTSIFSGESPEVAQLTPSQEIVVQLYSDPSVFIIPIVMFWIASHVSVECKETARSEGGN